MRNSERITANRFADCSPDRATGDRIWDIVLAVMSVLVFLAVTASAFRSL